MSEAAEEASTALARIVLEHARPEIQRCLSSLTMAANRLTPDEKEITLAALCDTSDNIFARASARGMEVYGRPLAYLAAVGKLIAAIHHADETKEAD